MIRAAAAALLLLCALVDPVAGMKLPLTKGRFGALKKLLVYVGSVGVEGARPPATGRRRRTL